MSQVFPCVRVRACVFVPVWTCLCTVPVTAYLLADCISDMGNLINLSFPYLLLARWDESDNWFGIYQPQIGRCQQRETFVPHFHLWLEKCHSKFDNLCIGETNRFSIFFCLHALTGSVLVSSVIGMCDPDVMWAKHLGFFHLASWNSISCTIIFRQK